MVVSLADDSVKPCTLLSLLRYYAVWVILPFRNTSTELESSLVVFTLSSLQWKNELKIVSIMNISNHFMAILRSLQIDIGGRKGSKSNKQPKERARIC